MENYTYDYIDGADTYLYQHKKMFRTDTDTVFLAQFMEVKEGERVLDIGTNSGALLLTAHCYALSYLYDTDIQPEAIAATEKNMEYHHITNVVLMVQDIHDAALEKMDIIVHSPPYFEVDQESNLNELQSLQMTRHKRFLTLRTLCQWVNRLLDEKRRFYMVHRASCTSEITYTPKQHHLEIHTPQFVYGTSREKVVGVLVEVVKDGEVNVHVLLPQIIER